MAVTFAGTQTTTGQTPITWLGYTVRPNVRITCTGTTTDNGDSITAANVGLTHLAGLIIHGNSVDSESNPENSFGVGQTQTTSSGVTTFKIVFTAQAVAGAATPQVVITDGTSVSNYVF